MRSARASIACIGLALLAAGCDSLSGRYLREGIGTELYTADALDSARLQELYVGYICQQAGLSFEASGDGLLCREAPVSPVWAVFVQAGMNDIDRRCDAYLSWLDNRRRWIGPIHQQILDTEAATLVILGATIADPTKAIAIVAAAFGLASHSFTNFNSRFLFEVEKSTVQAVVLTRQQTYRQTLPVVIDNRPAAIYALRQYLRLCMPMTIETQINTTVKLFERGGTIALEQSAARPMIDAQTVRTAVIRNASVPMDPPPRRIRTPGEGRVGDFEESLRGPAIRELQKFVCQQPQDGQFSAPLRNAVLARLATIGKKDPSAPNRLTVVDGTTIRIEVRANRLACS
jgi:hypothetical protein